MIGHRESMLEDMLIECKSRFTALEFTTGHETVTEFCDLNRAILTLLPNRPWA